MTVWGHAYPWDVIGDPGFADRVGELGLDGVYLAGAYHTVRAATPWHPERVLVDASHAAFYRPVDPAVWGGRRLRPAPGVVGVADAFGEAVRTLADAGIAVGAWLVLTHNSLLGSANPDLTVRNCFGDSYTYALCPSHPEVREYAATLAAAAVADLPLARVCLEACGQLGFDHGSHHDKTAGAYSAEVRRLLSVCCCDACAAGWGEDMAPRLRAAVRHAGRARPADPAGGGAALGPAPLAGVPAGGAPAGGAPLGGAPLAGALGAGVPAAFLPDDVEARLLGVRQAATDALRAEVTAATGALPVTLHGDPDPWVTGALPGLTPAARTTETVAVQCWPVTEESVRRVTEAKKIIAGRVAAYVTVLPPVADPTDHVRALALAGADELHLYHLGLAGPDRFGALHAAARTFRVITAG